METEAKFSIPDGLTARQLKRIMLLNGFRLGAGQTIRVRDTCFDTRARHLLAARNVLRVRHRSDGKTIVTLKAPAERRGAIHRRPETEVETDFVRTPRELSGENLPKRIYKLIAPLIGNEPLHPLLVISQTRYIRVLRHGQRVIGEWSVDHVTLGAGARRHKFYELEIELKKSGTEAELARIIEAFPQRWKLQPQPKSKFERALELMLQTS